MTDLSDEVGPSFNRGVSSGSRNKVVMKHLARCAPVEHLARSPIQQGLDMLYLTARHTREVSPFWEELSDQAVGSLVRAAPPRALRMGEEDTHPGCFSEQRASSHLQDIPHSAAWQSAPATSDEPTECGNTP